jgi:hypothetical protein
MRFEPPSDTRKLITSGGRMEVRMSQPMQPASAGTCVPLSWMAHKECLGWERLPFLQYPRHASLGQP